MPKWLIRLKGERFDLEDLPELLRSHEIKVVEENCSFYLELIDINPLTSADQIRERVSVLIKLINDVAKFNRDDFLDISEHGITRVEDDGKRQNDIVLGGTLNFRGKNSARVPVIAVNGSEKITNQPSSLESLFKTAQKHKVIEDALYFYRKDTWISLYKAYEIIRDDVGGKHMIMKNGWAINSDFSRFTQTAQSRSTLGDYARHASDKYKPPAQPMTLLEAKAFIKIILSQWVSSKT